MIKFKKRNSSSGFTLLEILLVVGIIALLAGIVIVAINPARQLASVRNAERKSDIKQIDSAITQYYIDNFRYPTGLTGTLKGICDTGSTSSPSGVTCTNLVDLSVLVPDYITAIPTDPQSSSTDTGYSVMKDANNKIVTTAPLAELDQVIAIGTSTVAVVIPPVGGEGCDVTVVGADETTDGDYTIQTFTDDGTFTVNTGTCDVEVLVVGGGGGGGVSDGVSGGGGGGGVVYGSSITLTSDTYDIGVGSGAVAVAEGYGGGEPGVTDGNSGQDSSFAEIIAAGGGGGSGGRSGGQDGVAGGSGGGGGYAEGAGGSSTQGDYDGYLSYGNAGGVGSIQSGAHGSGGGGGAGEAGQAGSPTYGGKGGDGFQTNISGVSTYYGGGGGGGTFPGYTAGEGGLGGGGAGTIDGPPGEDGTDGLGGGGGGNYPTWDSVTYSKGGDGVVIVRYVAAD